MKLMKDLSPEELKTMELTNAYQNLLHCKEVLHKYGFINEAFLLEQVIQEVEQ